MVLGGPAVEAPGRRLKSAGMILTSMHVLSGCPMREGMVGRSTLSLPAMPGPVGYWQGLSSRLPAVTSTAPVLDVSTGCDTVRPSRVHSSCTGGLT